MTNDDYMNIEHEHSSSQPPSDLLEAAHFHIPPPTNPELQRLREIGKLAPGISNFNQDASRSVISRSLSIPRVRHIGDPNHPARARAASIRSAADFTPSVAAAQDDFKHLMFDLHRSMKHRSDRVAAKPSRGASLHDNSRPVDGGVSKLSRSKPPRVRLEHTIAAPSLPSTVPARSHRSRLRQHTGSPRNAACVQHPMDQDDPSIAGSSRPIAHAILKSQISDPEYDFPSSTPTPSPKDPSRVLSSSASSQRSCEDSSSSLLSLRQWPTSRRDMPSARVTPSHIDSRDNSPSMDQDPSPPAVRRLASSEPMPALRAPHVPKLSTRPPASSATSMLLPANPVACQNSNTTSSMSTPFLPVTFNPIVAPSQVPGASTSGLSSMTQHPPPLGMLRRNAQSARFRTNKKPFKVPFAVKKDPVLLRHGTVSGVQYPDPARRNAAMEGARRSLSPTIPDPPYIVERARAEQTHTQPALEMTARRPEPVPMDEDKDAETDADSSADLWANVPLLDDIGDVP